MYPRFLEHTKAQPPPFEYCTISFTSAAATTTIIMKAYFQRRRRSSQSTSASSSSMSMDSIDPVSPVFVKKHSLKKAPRINNNEAPPSAVMLYGDMMDHSNSTTGTYDLTNSPSFSSPELASPMIRKKSIQIGVPPASPLLLPSIVGPSSLSSATTIYHEEQQQEQVTHADMEDQSPSFHLEQDIHELLQDTRQSLAQSTKQLLAIQKDASFHWERALLRYEGQQTTGVRLSLRKIHALQQTEQGLLQTIIPALTDQHMEASRLARKLRKAARANPKEPWVVELYATLQANLQDLQERYTQTTTADDKSKASASLGAREEALLMEDLKERAASRSSSSATSSSQ